MISDLVRPVEPINLEPSGEFDMDPFHFCSGTPGHFNQTPKTGTGTDPKIQIKVQI